MNTRRLRLVWEAPLEDPARNLSSEADLAYQMHTQWLLKLMEIIASVDETGLYERDGATSAADWVCNRFGMGYKRAQELTDVALALAKLPALRQAFAEGRISYDHLRALTQVAGPDNEADLLEAVETQGLNVGQTFKMVDRIKEVSAEDSESAQMQRWLQMRWDSESRCLILFAILPEESGVLVEQVIDRLAAQMPDDPQHQDPHQKHTPMGVKRADALAELAASASAPSSKPLLVVHTDAETLLSKQGVAEIQDGPTISPETLRRLACDCKLQLVWEDKEGTPLGVGRMTRKIPARLFRELKLRDVKCRFPGCNRKKWVQGHHIQHWTDDGETELDNLVLFCEFHHHFVHERKYRVIGTPPNITIERPHLPPIVMGPPRATHETKALFDQELQTALAGRSP